jgi:D-3-phosphoglycerate dehydrogenase
MPKVLISDKMSPQAADIFKSRGVDVDVKTGLSPDELKAIIGQYDGLAIRSSTTATPELIAAAKQMKVIGRAGIGVDNVDLPAATKQGIVVMNTPFGNSTTTAEHAIALMMALARQIPQASASTHAGKWEKSKFMGVEITGKTLGVIGCGNIGAIVASRAQGLGMKVLGFDPFLSQERAVELHIEKADLDTLLRRADFITVHTPLNEKTKHLLNKETLAKTKKGVFIINCARGGIVQEADLKEALDSGHVAGAALDVFEIEPAKDNILFGHERVIATPHLGASTNEAQENVALQVAEQMSDYLLSGAVINAVNVPSLTAEQARQLQPYLTLAEQMGSFMGQMADGSVSSLKITYAGTLRGMNVKPLTATLVHHLLSPMLDQVNGINALSVAKERSIALSETLLDNSGDYTNSIHLEMTAHGQTRSVMGSVFHGNQPRFVSVDDVPLEATVAPRMILIRNVDKPGYIGKIGHLLGEANVNIATFHLGRRTLGGEAISLIEVDQDVPEDIIAKIANLPQVVLVRWLRF